MEGCRGVAQDVGVGVGAGALSAPPITQWDARAPELRVHASSTMRLEP